MSGLVRAVGSVFRRVVNVVRTIAPYVAMAAAVYFTAGAALAAAPAAGAVAGGTAAAAAGSGVAATSTLGTVLASVGESAAIGGALGGGTALLRGQDPLQGMMGGALMGGLTGGVSAGLGGLSSAATTGAGEVAAGAGEAASLGNMTSSTMGQNLWSAPATGAAEAGASLGSSVAEAGIDAAGAGATSTLGNAAGSLSDGLVSSAAPSTSAATATAGPTVTAGQVPAMPFSNEAPSMLNAEVGNPTIMGGPGTDPIVSSGGDATDMLGRYSVNNNSVIDQGLARAPSESLASTYQNTGRGLLSNAAQTSADQSGGGVLGWVERNQQLVGGVVRGLGEGLMRSQGASDYAGAAAVNAQSAMDQRAALSGNYALNGRGLIRSTGVSPPDQSGQWVFDPSVHRYVFVPQGRA